MRRYNHRKVGQLANTVRVYFKYRSANKKAQEIPEILL